MQLVVNLSIDEYQEFRALAIYRRQLNQLTNIIIIIIMYVFMRSFFSFHLSPAHSFRWKTEHSYSAKTQCRGHYR